MKKILIKNYYKYEKLLSSYEIWQICEIMFDIFGSNFIFIGRFAAKAAFFSKSFKEISDNSSKFASSFTKVSFLITFVASKN